MTAPDETLEVWIDQDLCTGDGICCQYAPDVFELDIDGLAYVKDDAGDLQQTAGASVRIPAIALHDVTESVRECPAECIHVRRAADGVEVFGPDAETR